MVDVGWPEKQEMRGFGGDAEVKMGEEGRRGGAEIAQGLAYSGLNRRPPRPDKNRGIRRVLRKELSVD
jgi:hypothetical protein